MSKRRIPGSRRKRTQDAEELLDEALDEECQEGNFWKCERVGEEFYYL